MIAATPFASLPPYATRPLTIALAVSVALHAVALAIRFTAPEVFNLKAADPELEVVLVNAKSSTAPAKADVLAQVNLEGGGEHETGRARSPLPNSMRVEDGDSLRDARQRLERLEEEQRKLLTQLKKSRIKAPETAEQKAEVEPKEKIDAADLMESMKAVARMEAQIDKRVDDYNKRPRITQYSLRAREFPFAQYVESWREKIERVGTNNYPEAARGKMYGTLVMTVYIRADGTLDRVELDKPSKYAVLNKAALQIAKMAAPYPPLPPAVTKDTDILAITRTWIFTNETLETQQH